MMYGRMPDNLMVIFMIQIQANGLCGINQSPVQVNGTWAMFQVKNIENFTRIIWMEKYLTKNF